MYSDDIEVPDDRRSSSVKESTSMDNSNTKSKSSTGSYHASQTPGCCALFCAEFNPCQDWFLVRDPVTGKSIDVQGSFAPNTGAALISKCLTTGYVISTIVYAWISTEYLGYWFAYFTNWALLLNTFYSIMSLTNSLGANSILQPAQRVQGRPKFTWILFTMASHAEVVTVIIYWSLVYEPGVTDITYLSVVEHSAMAVMVLWDGLVVNRIPLRWMHYFGLVIPLFLVWMAWSIIHSLATDIGNPYENDSDAIYANLDWKEDWVMATIYSVGTVFVLGPIVFSLLWLSSLYNWPFCCFHCRRDRRRYLSTDTTHGSQDAFDDDNEQGPTDVEEQSIFARLWG